MEAAGWDWISAAVTIDDLGHEWDMRQDPPTAVQKAMRETARRMRVKQMGQELPHLIPSVPDVSNGNSDGDTLLIDLGTEAAMLAKGGAAPSKSCAGWQIKHRGSLMSAMSGGQWTQCRRAAVRCWEITVKMCQLCHEEEGTELHRHSCKAIMPHGGWMDCPPSVQELRSKLDPKRRNLLDIRGFFVLKVPKPPSPCFDTFEWLSEPPDVTDATLTWYIDGSLVNGKLPALATTGFAIVVTNRESDLVAWGLGVPPHWVTDAAGAEAWALALSLKMCPTAPKIITDCRGLLTETAAPARLTHPAQHTLSGLRGVSGGAHPPKHGRPVGEQRHR